MFTFIFTKRNNLLSMKQQKIIGVSEYRNNRRLLHAKKVEQHNDFQSELLGDQEIIIMTFKSISKIKSATRS